jgi:hypothetical protein
LFGVILSPNFPLLAVCKSVKDPGELQAVDLRQSIVDRASASHPYDSIDEAKPDKIGNAPFVLLF